MTPQRIEMRGNKAWVAFLPNDNGGFTVEMWRLYDESLRELGFSTTMTDAEVEHWARQWEMANNSIRLHSFNTGATEETITSWAMIRVRHETVNAMLIAVDPQRKQHYFGAKREDAEYLVATLRQLLRERKPPRTRRRSKQAQR